MHGKKYVPALSLRWLTPFYDSLIEGPMGALRMRKDLLAQIGDLSGKSLLDVGCGTGTFAIMVKQAYPAASVTGLDGDPQILEIARAKSAKLGLDIRFSEGMSYTMPYPDASFEVLVTSLMLHHLDKKAKQETAGEMFRVLKPGGRLFGIDFAEMRGAPGRALKPFVRRFERVAENLDGLLPVMFGAAGFGEYAELRRYVLGSIASFRAIRPA
jgi:ubiquinone/menaquinone biosynthesis C-methylase UbiE